MTDDASAATAAEGFFKDANRHAQAGDAAGALALYDRVIALAPSMAGAFVNRAATLLAMGDLTGALDAARDVIARFPQLAAAHAVAGEAALAAGLPHAAEAYFTAAQGRVPDDAAIANNLALALHAQGRIAEALAVYAKARISAPHDRRLASNMLMAAQYDPPTPNLLALAQGWPGADVNPARPGAATLGARRLRIGYVSPDFCNHSCSYFLVPVLAGHDRAAVELFAYSDVARPDGVTAAFRNLVPHWRDMSGRSDADFCQAVASDKIDVLVDCAGHTTGNRLAAFALRPAPVQLTWLGFPDTTGLRCFDARLVDATSDPEGSADLMASEPLARLEGGFLAYMPPPFAPPVGPLPMAKTGLVTFGSFNNLPKISDATVALWAGVLRAVPGARLIVKARGLAEPAARARLTQRFAAAGIAPDRVLATPFDTAIQDHIARYGDIDVALDTTPYNGTTTTLEALWMGVPVVALRGNRHAGRVGAALLAQIGAEAWVGDSPDEFWRIAAKLVADPGILMATRAGLRTRMARSPLCDGRRLARQIEKLCFDLLGGL
jgi:protein O-GlcNAc transferase